MSLRGGDSEGSLDVRFRSRDNALNVLRLVFAASVIVWHCFSIGNFALPAHLGFISDIGVDGFFIISGFLITRSWDRRRAPLPFAWHRFLRIMPGYWVCLLVAIVAGAIDWIHLRGALSGYFGTRNGPLDYLHANWHLSLGQNGISGTPARVPYADRWNIPLWTLHWEVKCYLVILVLGLLKLINGTRRAAILILFCGSYGLLIAARFDTSLAAHLPGTLQGSALRFASTFMAGSALYMYRDRVPIRRGLVLALSVVLVVCLILVPDYRVPALIPLAYLVIWLGGTHRGPAITNRHDISYGVYIYGYIAQQLLAIYGVPKLGFVPFAILSLLATLPFAVASWLLVERHALRLKNWTPKRGVASDPAVPEAAQ
jgi:peptidoglycan/LPS O-acetylase OafA/YrhL